VFALTLGVLTLGALALPGLPTASAQAEPARAQPARVEQNPVDEPPAERHPADAPTGQGLLLGELPEDFARLDAGWLQLEYHPSVSPQARQLAAGAESARDALRTLLGRPVLDRVVVRLARTPGEMESLAPGGARLPKYAAGVAFSELGLVLLSEAPRYPGERHDLGEIFRHELAHVALHDAVDRRSVPRWFNEGVAVYASGEGEMHRVQTLWTATVSGNLIPLAELERGFPSGSERASVAYAQAADFVRFLLARGEEHRFRALVERLAAGAPFERALADSYQSDAFSLEREWQKSLARRYTFWPILLGGSSLWVVGAGLVVVGYVRRRGRARRKLAAWAREEAAEDARRELARAVLRQVGPVRVIVSSGALLAQGQDAGEPEFFLTPREPGEPALQQPGVGGPLPTPRSVPLPPVPSVPKVEHDGGWHTLH
jgi:hypothetical protein